MDFDFDNKTKIYIKHHEVFLLFFSLKFFSVNYNHKEYKLFQTTSK